MNPSNRTPRLLRPIEGIIEAFEHADIVALGEVHGLQEEADLIADLITTPAFSDRVRVLVVEFGNAIYQRVIDRFVSGEAVRREELQRVWRDVIGALNSRAFESPIYERFFTVVRHRNQELPPERRIRVLLGDPPFDRRKVSDEGLLWKATERRDEHFAEVVEDHVRAEDRRALLIAGAGHFARIGDLPPPRRNVVQILEDRHPGSVRVVLPHFIFEDVYERRWAEAVGLEARLAAWPVPSLAPVRGTWLEEVDATLVFGDQARRINPDGSEEVVETPFLDEAGRPVSAVTLGQVVDDYLYLGRVDALSPVRGSLGS